VLAGHFQFLNELVKEQVEVDWRALEQSRLWRFHLHCFDYAVDLGMAYSQMGNKDYYLRFRSLVDSWIKENRVMGGDGWHPYPTSRRIVNWILASFHFLSLLEDDDRLRRHLFGSLHQQVGWLNKHLEFDLLGNHLFSNIRALFIAGCFFSDQDANRWRKRAEKLLQTQLDEQVLDDGCHFERSPMYHCIVLSDLLDCIAMVGRNKSEIREFMVGKAMRMLSFLRFMLYEDGTFPLFNDAALNMASTPTEIFAYADALLEETSKGTPFQTESRKIQASYKKASGYAKMQTRNAEMFIDGGKAGPDYQLGHAHCDLFSYELSVKGERFIVDSGVYGYEQGEMRQYCRSTQAHNTVRVDEEEQSEIWGSFRVARRAYPHNVTLEKTESGLLFSGHHDGYRRLRGNVVHKRRVLLAREGFWFFFDQIDGRGEHFLESFVHFHPEAQLTALEDVLRVNRGETNLSVVPFGGLKAKMGKGWHCPEFGKRYPNEVLVLSANGELPVYLGYLLVPWEVETASVALRRESNKRLTITITLEDHRYMLALEERTVRFIGDNEH